MPPGGGSSQSEPTPPLITCCFTIFHCNARGIFSKLTEINARIRLMIKKPSILCFTETWLNPCIGRIIISGYSVVVRRDRGDGRQGGGVIIFVADSIMHSVTPILVSGSAERVWVLLHSNIGPMLICCWYRPPDRGNISDVVSLRREFLQLRNQAISTFIVGDMNVHNVKWLLFSRENTPEGIALQRFSTDFGFHECVRAPTRGNNLVDLVLTEKKEQQKKDYSCVCIVLPKVADHKCVYMEFDMPITISSPVRRTVWNFGAADWRHMIRLCSAEDWRCLDIMSSCVGAEFLECRLLHFVSMCIPTSTFTKPSGNIHGLMNDVSIWFQAKLRRKDQNLTHRWHKFVVKVYMMSLSPIRRRFRRS